MKRQSCRPCLESAPCQGEGRERAGRAFDTQQGMVYGIGAMSLSNTAFVPLEFGRLVSGSDQAREALAVGLGPRF